MALVSSLFTAISGMQNQQTLLNVISNNIANVNTVGFKAGRVTFNDLLSQTLSGASGPTTNLGGINPVQQGTGVTVASIDTLMTQGSLQATGNATDVAVNGDGFFITSAGGQDLYTRAGSFRFDANGNLVDPSGGLVQGWNAKSTTLMAPPTIDASDPSKIGNIQVTSGMTLQAHETENVALVGNLDAGATAANEANSLGQPDTVQLTVTDGAAITTNPIVGQFKMPMTVYDSLGNQHQLTMTLTNLSGTQIPAAPTGTLYDNNTWAWTVDTSSADKTVHLALDNTTYNDPTNTNNTIRASSSGLVHFQTNGALDWVAYQDRNGEHFGTNATTGLPNDPTDPAGWQAIADGDALNRSIIGFEGATVPSPGGVNFTNPQAFPLQKCQLVLAYQNIPAPVGNPPANVSAGQLVTNTVGGVTSNGINVASGGGADIQNWFVQSIDINWGSVSSITQANFTPINEAAGDSAQGLDFVEQPTGITDANTGSRNGLTQDVTGSVDPATGIYNSTFSAHMNTQDGYAEGTLQSVNVSADGKIMGSFTNNQTIGLAQLAMARFQNPAGLAKVGNDHFTPTANSGSPVIATAGTNGLGSVVGGVVEQSNVDLTTELTNMIVAQRGFEVNARLVTTSDTILNTLVQLGR